MSNFDENEIYQLWLDYFIHDNLTTTIRGIADNYPNEKSLNIDIKKLFSFKDDLVELILDRPMTTLAAGESAIMSLQEPDQGAGINLRIFNLYSPQIIRIRDLRAEHDSKYIAIEGDVKKVSEVFDKILFGVFKCNSCGFKQEIIQDAFLFTEPLECSKDDGGCGKRAGSTSFHYMNDESLKLDVQKIMINEKRESLNVNEQSQNIIVWVEDDLCGKINGGEVVKITGIRRSKHKYENRTKTSLFEKYILGIHIDTDDVEGYKIEYTKEEIDKIILKLGINPLEKLSESLAPSIKGMYGLKQKLIIQQARGSMKVLAGGKIRRPDIHVLILGDPGTAKTAIAEEATSLIPGSLIVDGSGDNVSSNGLTAVAIKDDFGDGKYSLEAGATVMCDGKNLMIDESHLMKKECFGALRRPMESQNVAVAKGGINTKLSTRFTGIFIANPKNKGRFSNDPDMRIINQIDTTKYDGPWMERIDIIVVVYDNKDYDKTVEMIDHIFSDERGDVEPEISKEEMMKYMQYVRDNFNPTTDKELGKKVGHMFALERDNQTMRMGDFYIRHFFSITRIAEAISKINRRSETIEEDYEMAFKIVTEGVKALTAGLDGIPDPDAIIHGMSTDRRNDLTFVIDTLRRMIQLNENKPIKESNFLEILKSDMPNPEEYLDLMEDRNIASKDSKKRWSFN